MNSLEKWKPVPYPGFPYEVSDMGNVRRLSQASERVRKIHSRRDYGPKILGHVVNNGYHYVTLCGPNKRHVRLGVHRLVLEAFIGPAPDGAYGCHNDGDKSRNVLSNIRWDTPKSNQEDRVRHGNHQNGEKNGSAKLTKKTAAELIEIRARTRMPYKKLGAMFGVCAQTAFNVVAGKTKFLD